MPEKLTADQADDPDPITEVVIIGGDEHEIDVVDVSYAELTDLQERAQSGDLADDEAETRHLFDEYLLTPDITLDEAPRSWIEPLVRGIYRAWGVSDESIDEALEEYQPDEAEGN